VDPATLQELSVAYLASDDASFMTGAGDLVDGAHTAA
jgi:hypothetical protein